MGGLWRRYAGVPCGSRVWGAHRSVGRRVAPPFYIYGQARPVAPRGAGEDSCYSFKLALAAACGTRLRFSQKRDPFGRRAGAIH